MKVIPLWQMWPLIDRVRADYRVGKAVATSMVVSAGKASRLYFSVAGFPEGSTVLASEKTTLTDIADFAFALGLRPSLVMERTAQPTTAGGEGP